ncbi:glycosyltransferase family 2 protein [Agromyces sp. NPDC058104]|uniref:glycosyltransferase family 2 protein n=1 Tax=Agromyces sp. NPDC058104 TaxID=3346342 RepID=UPI0036DCB674
MTLVAEHTSAPPLLSVIVPSHNVWPWISETMQTILGQDLRDLEVIVVDDHSTDGTREILAGFQSRDERVAVIDATEFGGAAARNLGLQHASGRYLAFCDADDLVPRGAYHALVNSLEASGSEIAFGDFLKFSPTATWRPTSGWPAFAQPRVGFTLIEQPSIIRGRAVWNKVFRRDFWERVDIRFPESARSNDIVPMLTSYLAAQSFDLVDEIVYLYRERPGGSSMTSRARSSVSLRAYLEQELSCAELVAGQGDHGVSSVFAGVFREADGWKHLAEHLSAPERESDDDLEIGRLLDEIIRRCLVSGSIGSAACGAPCSHSHAAATSPARRSSSW